MDDLLPLGVRHIGSEPVGRLSVPTGPIRNRWALIVGVDHYIDPAFPSLRFCVSDVLALDQMLHKLGYTVVTLHDEVLEDRLLPSRTNIEAELARIAQIAGPEDLIWVHFSCHGKQVEQQPVLVTHESRAATLPTSTLPLAVVQAQMRSSQARRLVLTLDACHTGVEIGRDLSDSLFIQLAFESAEGFALIAGSTAQQAAQESEEEEHGVFTHFLLEGLGGAADRAGKAFVTVNDLVAHTVWGVRYWNLEHGGMVQEPNAHIEGVGDMILADYRGNVPANSDGRSRPTVSHDVEKAGALDGPTQKNITTPTCPFSPFGIDIETRLSLGKLRDYFLLLHWIFFCPQLLFEHLECVSPDIGAGGQYSRRAYGRDLFIQAFVASEAVFGFVAVAATFVGNVVHLSVVPAGMAWMGVLLLIAAVVPGYVNERASPERRLAFGLFIGVPTALASSTGMLLSKERGLGNLGDALLTAVLIVLISYLIPNLLKRKNVRVEWDPRIFASWWQRALEGFIGGVALGFMVVAVVPPGWSIVMILCWFRAIEFAIAASMIALGIDVRSALSNKGGLSLDRLQFLYVDTAVWIPLPGVAAALGKGLRENFEDGLHLADQLMSWTGQGITANRCMRSYVLQIPEDDVMPQISRLLKSKYAMTYLSYGDVLVRSESVSDSKLQELEHNPSAVILSKKHPYHDALGGVVLIGAGNDVEWLQVHSANFAARAGFLALALGHAEAAAECFKRVRKQNGGEEAYELSVLLQQLSNLLQDQSQTTLSIRARAVELLRVLSGLDHLPKRQLRPGTAKTLQQFRKIVERTEACIGSMPSVRRGAALQALAEDTGNLSDKLEVSSPWPERVTVRLVVESWQHILALSIEDAKAY